MTSFTRGLIVAAATLSIAAGPAFAQATIGPAGATPSITAPANGEGTPAGGTGTLSTTRVGPQTTPATRSGTSHRTARRYARHTTAAKRMTHSTDPSSAGASNPASGATGAGAGGGGAAGGGAAGK